MRFLLILSLFICSKLTAQHWAPLGATWHYEQGYAAAPGNYWSVITIVGDTIIQDRPCQILDNPLGQYQCFPFYPIIHYDGDSLWIFNTDDEQFDLLYCMNAVPGDVWQTDIRHSAGGERDTVEWLVLDTSTVIIDGIALRQLELEVLTTGFLSPHCNPHCTVIERIGNLKYMFDFMIGMCDLETFLGLRCYEDSEIDWLDPSLTSCELIMSIDEIAPSAGVHIMPNPARTGETIWLELEGSLPAHSELVIHDALGRELKRTVVGSDRTPITFTNSGIYFIQLAEHGRITRWQRLVVN